MLILNSRWTSKKHIFRKFSKFSPFYKGIQIQVMKMQSAGQPELLLCNYPKIRVAHKALKNTCN